MVDIIKEIEELLDKVERVKNTSLKEDLHKLGFYTCPASTKRHNAFNGGLALHNYNVYCILKDLNDKMKLKLDEDFIIITSLLHDVCKLGCYTPNRLKNGKISESKPYKYEDPSPLGHGEKSVIFLQEYINLKPEESLAIRYHIGPFCNETLDGWNRIAEQLKKTPYYKHIMATYHADSLASSILEDCNLQHEYHRS